MILHGTENHIFFFQTSWKGGLSKKLCWNMIFLVLSGKTIFLFPENMILTARRKMKDDLSQKIHGNMIFSSNVLKRWSFQKGLRWDMIYLVLSAKVVFFPRKRGVFSLGGNWGEIFFKKYMEILSFLCTRTGVTNVAPCPSVKKNQRWSCPAKIHQKVIDVLDWHSRKCSSSSL